jgi:hypothetical protein
MHEWVERSEKRARLAPLPHNLAVTLKRKVRGWPGAMLVYTPIPARFSEAARTNGLS